MRSIFDWIETEDDPRPWLILGKGPSFRRHVDVPDLDRAYQTLGLNHVCQARKVDLTHIIDANVLDEVPNLPELTSYLVMPMHPHFNFKPTEKTLDAMSWEHPVLREFTARDALLWYNLSNWPRPHAGSPVVRVEYFSAEAAVRILAMAGITTIRTLGIDGGSTYAPDFQDKKPFRGGHTSFDLQNKPIQATAQEFGLDLQPLSVGV